MIDRTASLGFSELLPSLKLSRHLRRVRKAAARTTGLHGLLSGKVRIEAEIEEAERRGAIRRRVAAISRAKDNVERLAALERASLKQRRGLFGFFMSEEDDEYRLVLDKDEEMALREKKRQQRVNEIDRQMLESQKLLQELACEKDVLQRRPNPLWNYTIIEEEAESLGSKNWTRNDISSSRRFNFPPQDLVDEYLEVLFSSGRLVKLNHTDLWRNNYDEDDDDDELASPVEEDRRRRGRDNGSGSWFLRHGLGEKIGEAAEKAGYKAVCAAIMGVLARSLSALHGVNIMTHSDIRLFVEQAPDLPPLADGIIPGSGKSSNYAQGALEKALRKGSQRAKKRALRRQNDLFIQRDFVVETLLSHAQISAPLLKLFPIAWQRAMLGNIVTLVTAVISDFFEGVEFSILGHRLSFAFSPITQADMLRSMGAYGEGFNRHRASRKHFEAAVKATADDLEEELKFLDRWHERALGSGVLRTQIANLIARLVLTLIDDILSGARMDLWTAHAGGPRLVAGLEYRTNPS